LELLLSAVFGVVTLMACIYALFEAKLLLGYWFARRSILREIEERKRRPQRQPARIIPSVTVQLPLYNEPNVARSLLAAVARLDYPVDSLTIQVLDDSTDGTHAIVAAEVAKLKAAGVPIQHIHRDDRSGWKAGAMSNGLNLTDSDFIAVFDADFTPPPDYLRRVLIDGDVFDDPRVAFLQGRWMYLNENANLLTRVQAILLDRHFIVQKPYQAATDKTTVFNGSAGIWRRSAIEDAGGWSSDTLCEDLDLSYRCAMKGYCGVYDRSLVCPSEIPVSMSAFKLQQRRWATGSAQCMRKLIAGILTSRNLRHKPEDIYIVAGYVVHPILFLYLLLWPWVVMANVGPGLQMAGQISLGIANVLALVGFMTTTIDSDRKIGLGSVANVAFALVLGMALMVNNSIAFFTGCLTGRTTFERTPKTGNPESQVTHESPRFHWGLGLELACLVYSLFVSALLVERGLFLQAMPCLTFALCIAFIVIYQVVEAYRPPFRSVPVEV
jgi:cellulose synthase/poly-beta-1,6-N-acetylglucosamine synthase-like glycosyltransferase